MTNINLVKQKIEDVKRIYNLIKRYRRFSLNELKNSKDIEGMIAWYLFLDCQYVINLGEMVISHKNLSKPECSGDTFDILFECGIISRSLAEKMRKLVGFRNIIAHNYGKIKLSELYKILQKDSDDINEFALVIKKKMY